MLNQNQVQRCIDMLNAGTYPLRKALEMEALCGELRAALNRPTTETPRDLPKPALVERGPWSVYTPSDSNDVYLSSDDFTHDALLKVQGNFEDKTQRIAYADMLVSRLNSVKVPQ